MNESGALLAEARRHHLTKVNDVLRRPGMYGRDEMAERLLLEAMAAVDGALEQWQAECEALRERQAFTATGVMGAYGYVLPADAVRDATASVYAEIAHHLGWLHLDRALSEAEFQQLAAEVDEWVTRNRTLPEVVDRFGTPSLWTGPASSCHPKTLAYTTADPEQRLICFHLGNALRTPKEQDRRTRTRRLSFSLCVIDRATSSTPSRSPPQESAASPPPSKRRWGVSRRRCNSIC